MKKTILTIVVLAFITNVYSQVHYKSSEDNRSIYYEEILDFSEKSKQELLELTKKYLLINNYSILYEDDNDIYAIGKLETKYRSWFLFFFKTKLFNCVYDLKVSFKDEKLKYEARNFILLYKNYNVNTTSWLNNSNAFGPAVFSTTKIPTEVPKKPVDVHYRAKKTDKKHLLFQDLNRKMGLFEDGLSKTIQMNEDDW